LNLKKLYGLYCGSLKNHKLRKLYEDEFHKLKILFKKRKNDVCHKFDVLFLKIYFLRFIFNIPIIKIIIDSTTIKNEHNWIYIRLMNV